MTKPTIIKGPLPGQAVEEFRIRNGGKLPGANVVVSLDMVDDALNLLEGWIVRYCNPRFRDEHIADLAEKRAALMSAPEQTPIAKSEMEPTLPRYLVYDVDKHQSSPRFTDNPSEYNGAEGNCDVLVDLHTGRRKWEGAWDDILVVIGTRRSS